MSLLRLGSTLLGAHRALPVSASAALLGRSVSGLVLRSFATDEDEKHDEPSSPTLQNLGGEGKASPNDGASTVASARAQPFATELMTQTKAKVELTQQVKTFTDSLKPTLAHMDNLPARTGVNKALPDVTAVLERAEGFVSRASAAAMGTPAPQPLVKSAAKLQPGDNGVWKLNYGHEVLPYVDAAGFLDRIHVWAERALVAAVNKRRPIAPSPLVVSGPVKTGKSYAQEHVVPAVVAEALRKQGEQGPLAGMVVLRLSGDQLNREEGATVMLRHMLKMLLRWACVEHVPMREGAVQAAQDVLAHPFFPIEHDTPGDTILDFLKAVEVPVLVLFDEVQSFFLPTMGNKLDASGARYIRNTFMKQLLVYGPHTMLWCLTGSSMAHTWISLANMPPNGFPVITSAFAAHLPATYSDEHMKQAWELLSSSSDVPLHPKLLELCPPSIAFLTYLVDGWINAGRPGDVAAFVRKFTWEKLVYESLKDWKLGLEGMPSTQLNTVLDLSFPNVGARSNMDLHPGLQRFLAPHLDQAVDGRFYLRDSHQRQILRMLFNKDGTLRKSWSDLKFSATLTQLDGAWNLFYLGEVAHYLLGPNASSRWKGKKPPAGLDEFRAKLQALANEIAAKLASKQGGTAVGPLDLWEQQPWFQKVLLPESNDKVLSKYKEDNQARSTDLDMLVLYLRLSRNVLAHMKPWDREDGSMVDVDVVEALPRVLEQPLSAFIDVMVGALRVLSRQTLEKATAEFEPQLSGGSGSSKDGLAEDMGDSSGGGLSSGTDGRGLTAGAAAAAVESEGARAA